MIPTLAEQARRLNRSHRGIPPLVLMTDPRLDPLPLLARLPPGSAVILRHYGRPDRMDLGMALARACRVRRLRLLVANDVRLAALLRADGLHLAEGAARRPGCLPRRTTWLLSVAAHSLPALRRARRLRADWALLSPVFATASHPGAPTLGECRFAHLARQAGLPVLALGGITARTARRLHGAAGVATVGGLG